MNTIKDYNQFTNWCIVLEVVAHSRAVVWFQVSNYAPSVKAYSFWNVVSKITFRSTIIALLFVFYSKDFTSWANHLLKRGKRRTISDIRRSVGDGQTLVHILEILGELNYSRYFFKNHCLSYYIFVGLSLKQNQTKRISLSRYKVSTVCVRTDIYCNFLYYACGLIDLFWFTQPPVICKLEQILWSFRLFKVVILPSRLHLCRKILSFDKNWIIINDYTVIVLNTFNWWRFQKNHAIDSCSSYSLVFDKSTLHL